MDQALAAPSQAIIASNSLRISTLDIRRISLARKHLQGNGSGCIIESDRFPSKGGYHDATEFPLHDRR